MKKYLITGVSSGIGRALATKLVGQGNIVWGIARREKLLRTLSSELKDKNFIYTTMDLSQKKSWKKLVTKMNRKKFKPQIIVFNAAIILDDLKSTLNPKLTRDIFEVNFFTNIEAIQLLLKMTRPKTQFIAISSSSALKGNSLEGIGYPASKAALSIAFESLHQKYKNRYLFQTIYFGSIASGMNPLKGKLFNAISEHRAVEKIIEIIENKQPISYCPICWFAILKIIKCLPPKIYFTFLDIIEKHYKNTIDKKI